MTGKLHKLLRGGVAALAATVCVFTLPAAAKMSMVYGFDGTAGGARMFGTPLLKDGKLFIATTYGGHIVQSAFVPGYGAGTIDELLPPAQPGTAWRRITLHEFKGQTDGSSPYAGLSEGLVPDSFFGTTLRGGNGDENPGTGDGTVFELRPPAPGEKDWQETVLHVFGGPGDGTVPASRVIVGKDGALYGTTLQGGNRACGGAGCGVIYRLKQATAGGKAWTETVLYRFRGGRDGSYPLGDLISDGRDGFYGTTPRGGTGCAGFGCGTVFHLTQPKAGEQAWHKETIHYFGGKGAGKAPSARLLLDQGHLYGTTAAGGRDGCGSQEGCGVIFELLPAGTQSWKFKVLHAFTGGKDGAIPYSELTPVPARHTFYGTTSEGGSGRCAPYEGCGTIYRLTESATGWHEDVLFSFGEPEVGGTPFGGVTLSGGAGTLYGATARLGSHNTNACKEQGCGKIYEFNLGH